MGIASNTIVSKIFVYFFYHKLANCNSVEKLYSITMSIFGYMKYHYLLLLLFINNHNMSIIAQPILMDVGFIIALLITQFTIKVSYI